MKKLSYLAIFALISLLVWWVAPNIRVFDYAPFANAHARIGLIGSLSLLWFCRPLIRHLQLTRTKLSTWAQRKRFTRSNQDLHTEQRQHQIQKAIRELTDHLKKGSKTRCSSVSKSATSSSALPCFLCIGDSDQRLAPYWTKMGCERLRLPSGDLDNLYFWHHPSGIFIHCSGDEPVDSVLRSASDSKDTQAINATPLNKPTRQTITAVLESLLKYRPEQPLSGIILPLSMRVLLSAHRNADPMNSVQTQNLEDYTQAITTPLAICKRLCGGNTAIKVLITDSEQASGFSTFSHALTLDETKHPLGTLTDTVNYDTAMAKANAFNQSNAWQTLTTRIERRISACLEDTNAADSLFSFIHAWQQILMIA